MIPILAIVGPTAVGKTALSLEVAQALGGEIVSADSMQVYKYLDVGTAKPTISERERVKHHLIDFVDPAENYNVARFQKDANLCIKSIHKEGKLPVLVGGTGLYVNAVIFDYEFTQSGDSPEFRDKLSQEAKLFGTQHLYQRLKEQDPVSAKAIHQNDVRRIIRALEVLYSTGKPIHEQVQSTQDNKPRYKDLIIGINRPREQLYKRIDQRVEAMIAEGLLDEVASLLQKGYSGNLKSLTGLGYKHMITYIDGEYDFESAVEVMKRDTRRFAKRQLTWFRKNKGIIWFTLENDSKEELVKASKNICALAQENLISV